MISILVADPPWQYRDKLQMDLVSRSSDDQYKTLTVSDICNFLQANGHVPAPVSILFLWVTNPFLISGEGVRVARSWGYEPKQFIPWVKGRLTIEPYIGEHGATVLKDGDPDVHGAGYTLVPKLILRTGMGFYTRGVTEHLIVATRGTATSLIKSKSENGLIVAPEEAFILGQRGAHSEKPEASYQLIERLCHGPYTELFARKRRPGWECFGDQLS